MNKRMSMTLICIVLVAGAGILSAQWQVYDCSLLPAEADTAWHEQGDNDDHITDILSVIDDPDIPGNKLIQVLEDQGPAKEQWAYGWNADPGLGATLVFRAKSLGLGAFDRDLDVYLYNGAVRERFVANKGTEIKLNKAGQSSPMDLSVWHIYRITIIADLLEVFVDEDPLSYLSAQGEPLEAPGDNLFRFGDLGSTTMGSLFDWFAWDISGAYPPETGTPIPQELIDTGSMSTSVNQKAEAGLPGEFHLEQNVPNPFNPATEIIFSLTEPANTVLTVFNVRGQEIETIVNENLDAGPHRFTFDAGRHPAGIYYYQLRSGNRTGMKKMVLMK
ncbi:T9SS type A sorting domain-containing protein [bacterium]|nr:T9SS type A sorting domain-containing protein [bacterium]